MVKMYVSGQIALTEDIGEPYKVRIGFMGGTSGVQKYLPQSVSTRAPSTLRMIIVNLSSHCVVTCVSMLHQLFVIIIPTLDSTIL